MAGNKVRRCDHGVTLASAKGHRDHVLCETLAITHARVEALLNNIDQRRLHYDLQFDLRKLLEKRCHHWPEHQVGYGRRRIDAQMPRWHVAQPPDLVERGGHIAHRRSNAFKEHGAGLG